MTCGMRSLVVSKPVFSNGQGSGAKVFIAFHRMRVDAWKRARVSVVRDTTTSTDLQTSTAARYANVESELPAATPVLMPNSGNDQSDDGQKFGSAFATLDDGYQIVEFGVQAWNDAASAHEMAQMTLTIDLQE